MQFDSSDSESDMNSSGDLSIDNEKSSDLKELDFSLSSIERETDIDENVVTSNVSRKTMNTKVFKKNFTNNIKELNKDNTKKNNSISQLKDVTNILSSNKNFAVIEDKHSCTSGGTKSRELDDVISFNKSTKISKRKTMFNVNPVIYILSPNKNSNEVIDLGDDIDKISATKSFVSNENNNNVETLRATRKKIKKSFRKSILPLEKIDLKNEIDFSASKYIKMLQDRCYKLDEAKSDIHSFFKENPNLFQVHVNSSGDINYHIGEVIGEGGFKKIYKIDNNFAISEMSFYNMVDNGTLLVLINEILISFEVSKVAIEDKCPFILKCVEVFETYADLITKKTNDNIIENYKIYIKMELCNLNDIETYFKKQTNFEKQIFDLAQTKVIFFQMCYSLFLLQKELNFAHYDVKLLNYFLTEAIPERNTFSVGNIKFELYQSSTKKQLIAKLADFGTSSFSAELKQLTTYENTPINYFLEANPNSNNFDSWQLGLCFFHLHSGGMPYEEILEDVTCSKAFKNIVRKQWQDNNYFVLTQETEDDPDELINTFYKYIVLFSEIVLPTSSADSFIKKLQTYIKRKKRSKVFKTYSLLNGHNKYIVRARKRLLANDRCALNLLKHLLKPSSEQRFSAKDALLGEYLKSLRI